MLLTGMDGYLQLITVLVVFVVVLSITALVTKYIARYQKAQSSGSNIEVLETIQIAAGKYIQLIRLGDTYAAIAVCKDTVTMLCQVPKEQIARRDQSGDRGWTSRSFWQVYYIGSRPYSIRMMYCKSRRENKRMALTDNNSDNKRKRNILHLICLLITVGILCIHTPITAYATENQDPGYTEDSTIRYDAGRFRLQKNWRN